jgi:hypothetical protein
MPMAIILTELAIFRIICSLGAMVHRHRRHWILTTAIFAILSTIDDLCQKVTLRVIVTIVLTMGQHCCHQCHYLDCIINGSPLSPLVFVATIRWFLRHKHVSMSVKIRGKLFAYWVCCLREQPILLVTGNSRAARVTGRRK